MPLSSRAGGVGQIAVGAEVQLTADAALAFQLAKDHGGWAPPMADCLGRCGTVVDVVNSQGDVRVNCGDYGSYVWNPAAIVGPASSKESIGARAVLALDLHPRRLLATLRKDTEGSCNVCRRDLLEVLPLQSSCEATQAAAQATEPPCAFCSKDGAFRLCVECAAPYMEPSLLPGAEHDASAAVDCPGRHGLGYVCAAGASAPSTGSSSPASVLESASCDLCARTPLTVQFDEAPRGCRACNWVACCDCTRAASASSRPLRTPHLEIGATVRAERRGKPARAVVVDAKGGQGTPEQVLLHYPGLGAENDEWEEVTSYRIAPVNPLDTLSRFHPAHRSSLSLARLPRGADQGPKCAAEGKFAGGCRRYTLNEHGEPPPAPSPAIGLYCERTEFFLCPWCASDEVVENASTVAATEAAQHADVQALKEPSRCGDAAARIQRQCSRSVGALAGLLRQGVVRATADALFSLAIARLSLGSAISQPSATSFNKPMHAFADAAADAVASRNVLSLLLDLAEWLFLEPPPPVEGDQVLCEAEEDMWRFATITSVTVDADGNQVFEVKWAAGGTGDFPETTRAGVQLRQLRRLCGFGALHVGRQPLRASLGQRRSSGPRQRVGAGSVPPPANLTKDFLMKKAIPSDNTAQARQYMADGADLAALSESGDSALVLALEHGCTPKMVELLLEFGCPLTAGKTLGEPLALAARYGQGENIELLLDARADPRTFFSADLPERSAKRIAPLAALLGIGSAGDTAATTCALQLRGEREALAAQALPPLIQLLARPPDELLEPAAVGTEARLLRVLDELLGAWSTYRSPTSERIPCLWDVSELLQRLMATYSQTACVGALLLTRRLHDAGDEARAELARCGARRFVEQVARTPPGASFPGDACYFEWLKDKEVEVLAQEVLAQLNSSGNDGPAPPPSPSTPLAASRSRVLSELRELANRAQSLPAGGPVGDLRVAALRLLRELGAMLQKPGGEDYSSIKPGDSRGAMSAFELEAGQVPEALVTLLEHDVVSGADLLECDGNSTGKPAGNKPPEVLLSSLLRLVETTEALSVQPLPAHLSHPPGLRVLCEPIVVALLGDMQAIDGDNQVVAYRPPGLEKIWLQIEPLLRMAELERAVLLTTPVIERSFLEWCVGLVGQEVEPSGGLYIGSPAAVSGRIVKFRLATNLRLPVHTLRRSQDGREVELVATVHGLAAAEDSPKPPPTHIDLRVSLLRLEAATAPADVPAMHASLHAAASSGHAFVGSEADASAAGLPHVPPGAEEVLRDLGFQASGGVAGAWACNGDCRMREALGEILAKQSESKPGAKENGTAGDSAGIFTTDPDPDLVAEMAAIFSENGARRACSAVQNASLEAAMEWACNHQGDPDFNDPLPDNAGGVSADPRAPVWSVFICLPAGIPFELVWPELEDHVKGALTSVANAWTAMGWAGGEAEMRETLRTQVQAKGEGAIARGLIRSKADRVASRLRAACECRVDADPVGAALAPSGGRVAGGTAASLALGARIQLVLEAEQLGFVAGEASDGNLDIITDDGRLLENLPSDQVRVAPRMPPLTGVPTRPGLPQGASGDGGLAPTCVAEPIQAQPLVPLQCNFQALDRGAQESDVVRRFQPSDLLSGADSAGDISSAPGQSSPPKRSLVPAPQCRVTFTIATRQDCGLTSDVLCLLRGERFSVRTENPRAFVSTSWLTVGTPGLLAPTTGAWYYEVQLAKFKNPQVGWADLTFRYLVGAYSDDGVGDDGCSWAADCERKCLWHKGCAGDWRTATAGATVSCAICFGANSQARLWFAIDGVWDSQPAFCGAMPYGGVYPAVSGELDATFHLSANEMVYPPPGPQFRPIAEVVDLPPKPPAASQADDASGAASPSLPSEALLPRGWTALQGLYHISQPAGMPDAVTPVVVRARVQTREPEAASEASDDQAYHEPCLPVDGGTFLALQRKEIAEGLPLQLSEEQCETALMASGLNSPAARASLRLLRELRAVPVLPDPASAPTGPAVLSRTMSGQTPSSLPRSISGALSSTAPAMSCGENAAAADTAAPDEDGVERRGASRRLGAKLWTHVGHPLACCAGAFPRWCRELPIIAPWLFPLEAREVFLRCSAFGVTFAVRWLQERAVEERFSERRRNAEGRLAQAKLIGDAALLNSAYESLFELQGQIARDPEAWVGSLKSELLRIERERVIQQATRAMELTRSSPCSLEVQFDGESGFGRAVTQGFYTLVAHDLQRRSANREAPMWVEDDPPLNEEFLRPRRGLLARPLPPDDERWPEVERRFSMLGRLMAKALREDFVVPLPLTADFFQLMLGGPVDPLTMLPRPGDGTAGEFIGACAKLVADANAKGGSNEPVAETLAALAVDPEWSRKYMQPPNEEPIAPAPFDAYASSAAFVETGVSGHPLCPGGENRSVDVGNVAEFVQLATNFWLVTGVQRQMAAFRRGLYDVLGNGAVALWAFSPAELRRLFCGEDEVVWTEKELAEHLDCGGGYSSESETVRWLREELLDMAQPYRAKFLEFVTSCPRLPPGGLKELQLSVHPDPAGGRGLPRSRACAHRLFLPRYASREELARQLNEAILSSGGHHELQLPP
eukprot:TRINITY_DN44870_c0_g1_i1.p1 TRINITY_DN44870_c0_g1~~TRINITY_DN44870_c0_g1_i1.p1  ORF type:complete len:2579 (-),score=467.18 TRINITY_DN44870_c0_g1_i1:117-7853(-)